MIIPPRAIATRELWEVDVADVAQGRSISNGSDCLRQNPVIGMLSLISWLGLSYSLGIVIAAAQVAAHVRLCQPIVPWTSNSSLIKLSPPLPRHNPILSFTVHGYG